MDLLNFLILFFSFLIQIYFYKTYNFIETIFFIIFLGIGDWGLGIGDWGLGIGVLGPIPKPQNPKPQTQNPKN
jgi:hypothetical protein